MELAVLDQTPLYQTSTPQASAVTAVQESIQLAQDCEALGWNRFWIAEHHEMSRKSTGCGSPEILVAAVAAATRRMRVGTAAVLLPHYTPLKVATTFNLLERLYPNRIDLGVGRGPGGSPAVISRLASQSTQGYDSKLSELLGHLSLDGASGTEPSFLPPASAPQVMVNGSSAGGAAIAAASGLPFILAQFVHQNPHPELVEQYRTAFRSSLGKVPFVGVGAMITCTDDAREAANLRALLRGSKSVQAQAHATSGPPESQNSLELDTPNVFGMQALIGTQSEIEPHLNELIDLYRPDLLAVTSFCPEYSLRVRSYELVQSMVSARISTACVPPEPTVSIGS